MLREVSPMALDFNETYMKRLNESFDLIANGVQYTWPGVGGMTIMNGGISWHSGNWSLYGGGFGGRFFSPFNPSPGITAGANVQVEYQPTDWLKLKGWDNTLITPTSTTTPYAQQPFSLPYPSGRLNGVQGY